MTDYEDPLRWYKFDMDHCKKRFLQAEAAYKEAQRLHAAKKPAPVASPAPKTDPRQLELFALPPATVPEETPVSKTPKTKKVLAPSIPAAPKAPKAKKPTKELGGGVLLYTPPPPKEPVVKETLVSISEVNRLLALVGCAPLNEENPVEFYEVHPT